MAIIFILVRCENPLDQNTDPGMGVVGYTDPAVEGATVILSCSPGQILSGPQASICMENGEWEPDPKKAECIGIIINIWTFLSMPLQYMLL